MRESLRHTNGSGTKNRLRQGKATMRREYRFDYATAQRGKYYRRILQEGSNVVVLDPDVASAFRDSASVNEALRSLLTLSDTTHRLTARSTRRTLRRPTSSSKHE